MPESTQRPVTARLVISESCAYCKNTLAILDGFTKQGLITEPEIINLSQQPDQAEKLGVRSVPWLQLNDLVFEGAHSRSELESWINRMRQSDYRAQYLGELLENGRLPLARQWLGSDSDRWQQLVSLAANEQTPMTVRIGIGALFEDNEGSDLLQPLAIELAKLCRDPDPRIRADGCYFLSLTHSAEARPVLERCLQDSDNTVREIAKEGLEKLGTH